MRFPILLVAAISSLASGAPDGPLNRRSFILARAEASLNAISVTNINDVRGNIFLPETSDGLAVRWSSSHPSIISEDGRVKRQEGDIKVTLRATVEHEGVAVEREFTSSVHGAVKKRQASEYEGYAFSYFIGSSIQGEKIYFAASIGNDALNWRELNAGQPVLASTKGTTGLRDPFMIRSPEGDTFYLIATDLSIGSGTSWGDSVRFGSRHLEVWESHDLVNWSGQRHVLVSPPNAGNTWAPEAYYDPTIGAYVVFWASSLYADGDVNRTGSTYHRMLYATTRDFVTFSGTQVWQDAGMSRIDSTVTEAAGVFYRFTKDEGATGTGCSDIIQERSSSLRAALGSWTMVDNCIGRDAGTLAVEGPTIFRSNPGDVRGEKFYLFVDEYVGRGYIPLETDDIASPQWRVSPSFSLPRSPRHGTVIPVTAAELALLAGTTMAPRAVTSEGEILRYDFSSLENGNVLPDMTGNAAHGKVFGAATLQNGALVLDGVDDFVALPFDLVAGVGDITIETEVVLDKDQQTPYFIFGIGNAGASGSGNGYLFATGNPFRASITLTNWSAEQTVSSGSNLPRGQWLHLTYVIRGRTTILYLDGSEVDRNTQVTIDPGLIGGGVTSANYIGRSMYSSDRLFKGQIRKFVVYNRALSPAEVLTKSGNRFGIIEVGLSNASAQKVSPLVDGAARLAQFYINPGTDLSSLAPTFSTADGVTSSPASGSTVNFSGGRNVSYTLTAADGTSATWAVRAATLASPVLPGLYADPNIFIHNRMYYIYATTDGYAGWGGKDFYVWHSRDLVSWTRTADPILTLDGANGNVPWATGNAWAPGIIERGGRFYLYHSGHHVTLGRKTIGVAVAPSPLGPFTAQAEAMILNNEAVTSGQAIDPAAFRDPVSGRYYLYWGNGRPLSAELADDMVSLRPNTTTVLQGLVDFREGLFVVHRDGLYHLTYSIDDTGSEDYRVGYATSTSPAGPWTYRGVVLSKRAGLGILGTGHNSMARVPGTDDWYIAYHRLAIPDGDGNHRETTVDRVEFDAVTGLMKVVTPTLEGVPAQVITSD